MKYIILILLLTGCATTQKPTQFKLGVEVIPPMGYGDCVEVGICDKN